MKPYELLAHRFPFVMPDVVEVSETERIAKGRKLLTGDDPVLRPDGTLPEVFIIESMAQISGIAGGRKTDTVLAALNGITFSGSAVAGDILEMESSLVRAIGGLCIFACRASVSGKTIAEGEIMLHFKEPA